MTNATSIPRCRHLDRAHEAHGTCPGVTHLASLTLPQVGAVATALGLNPFRLLESLLTARAEGRV